MPSIFFIGSNGQPIDVVTGAIASSQELYNRIKGVASQANVILPSLTVENVDATPGPSAATASSSSSPSDEVVCDGDVCRKVTKPTETPPPASSSTQETPPASTSETAANAKALEERVKLAKELLEKKRQEKEKEDAKVGN